MRVLIVDDHALFRDGLASLLEARGTEVVGQAAGGDEAVQKALAVRPEVILMDLKMPRGSGLAATREIRQRIPESKIIVLTASEDDQDLFEAIKSGAHGYLLKDLKADELFEMLETANRGEAAITPRLAAKILGEFARQDVTPGANRCAGNDLTEREVEVLRFLVAGKTNREIGRCLYLSENTVKYHLRNILDKLHLHNRAQVVAYAMSHRITGSPHQ